MEKNTSRTYLLLTAMFVVVAAMSPQNVMGESVDFNTEYLECSCHHGGTFTKYPVKPQTTVVLSCYEKPHDYPLTCKNKEEKLDLTVKESMVCSCPAYGVFYNGESAKQKGAIVCHDTRHHHTLKFMKFSCSYRK